MLNRARRHIVIYGLGAQIFAPHMITGFFFCCNGTAGGVRSKAVLILLVDQRGHVDSQVPGPIMPFPL